MARIPLVLNKDGTPSLAGDNSLSFKLAPLPPDAPPSKPCPPPSSACTTQIRVMRFKLFYRFGLIVDFKGVNQDLSSDTPTFLWDSIAPTGVYDTYFLGPEGEEFYSVQLSIEGAICQPEISQENGEAPSNSNSDVNWGPLFVGPAFYPSDNFIVQESLMVYSGIILNLFGDKNFGLTVAPIVRDGSRVVTLPRFGFLSHV